MTSPTDPKLKAARLTIRALMREVAKALQSAQRWRHKLREERVAWATREKLLRSGAEEEIEHVKASYHSPMRKAMEEQEQLQRVVTLQNQVQEAKDSIKSYVETLRVLRAEMDRVRTLAPSKPVAWCVGELKRLRGLAEDGTPDFEAPGIVMVSELPAMAPVAPSPTELPQ